MIQADFTETGTIIWSVVEDEPEPEPGPEVPPECWNQTKPDPQRCMDAVRAMSKG